MSNSTSASTQTTQTSTTVASLNTSTPPKNETDQASPDGLPLEPSITPALGAAGIILLASGLILALIGIRNLRLQVFLSTTLLTALGVTVLIIYVMSPPVRDAIQGAYLVAVFFTGITFGALAIVFKELTEGLGCLLGGFCSSMWLLSLKPGGLLTETDSKSGFIGAFSVVFYALSFSQYTRPYGLIVSTGISGGTAVALGIDCFSRAGLKEFWLYMWALNNNVFPLGTNSYPVTRNIRVELAATVIITILGVVSQLKLWRVIRERRHKDEQIRAEEKRKKDEAEAEVSKRLEQNNMKERLEWEAKYNNTGPSIPELPGDAKCPADIEVEKDEGAESITRSSERSYWCSDCRDREANGESAYASSVTSDTSEATEGSQTRQQEYMGKTIEEDAPMQPLGDGDTAPAKMVNGAIAAQMTDDKSSDMTAIVGSETGTVLYEKISEKCSWDTTSVRSIVRPVSQTEEAPVAAKDDSSPTRGKLDAKNASTSDNHTLEAAGDNTTETIPDAKGNAVGQIPVVKEIPSSPKGDSGESVDDRSVYSREVEEQKLCPMQKFDVKKTKNDDALADQSKRSSSASSSSSQGKDVADECKKEQSTESLQQSEQIVDATAVATSKNSGKTWESGSADNSQISFGGKCPKTAEVDLSSEDKDPSKQNKATLRGQKSPTKSKLKAKPKKEERNKLDTEAVTHLPQRNSKMVQTYRTNEWAKQLTDADIPEPEPIQPFDEERPERAAEVSEAAAPVRVDELLQTPLNAQPPPAVEKLAALGREPSYANEDHRISNSLHSRQASKSKKRSSRSKHKHPPSPLVSTSNSPQYLPTAAQSHSALEQTNGAYSLLPLSPGITDQSKEETEVKPQWKGPRPLLEVREGMMRSRLSSFSLSSDPWSSRTSPGVSSTELSPKHSTFPIPEEVDDMPLSQRRTMLHQQASLIPQTPMRWSGNRPVSVSSRVPSPAPAPVNAHAAMAGWRGYVREDLYDKRKLLGKTNYPVATAGTEDRDPFVQAQRNSVSTKAGNSVAEGKQRGDMSDLHRNAMRRMQALANRKMNGNDPA
ncbi:hypothetical protein EYZ11_006649 [Aspergillus tanneri]|uniref:TM7S3/TM198-like domain-containing protein n=1 Tax=Aspergillus tanneri TaxID=1220188 RepID=A0A4S3JH72_9EURO|nr:uncharacterized protein ATNIH1004_010772 [Aspergillus tanneri]KAA8641833.1 hypothetical protein ATNIH1004_010772 [Aspergillus tanneri]THC93867.1 hypothetical protein EYZ11_006649 [Aspergillus tanneri]